MSVERKHMEEVETLLAIYGKEFQLDGPTGNSYSIEIVSGVRLYVTFHEDYPSKGPPIYQLFAPELNGTAKNKIILRLNQIYSENVGESVVYQWIEGIREIAEELGVGQKSSITKEEIEVVPSLCNSKCEKSYNIVHGELICDRKSTFQAHYCAVSSLADISKVREELLSNRKLAQATHNVVAFRISINGVKHEDYDDDGENHAGGKLLLLLQLLEVTHAVVIVTRWYGGVHLGNDRFRDYCKAARQVLQQVGVAKTPKK